MQIDVAPHPLLDLRAFLAEWDAPIGDGDGRALDPDALRALLGERPGALAAPVDTRVYRDLLRHGGFKPAGRSKPCSEYLVRAAAQGRLGAINPLVDRCNAACLHSGVPISAVDADCLSGPLSVRIAAAGAEYVFNASGQVIDVEGLLCLFDGDGPCANAVKDSHRTKTGPATTRALALVWGSTADPGRAAAAAGWFRASLDAIGARTRGVVPA